MRECLPTGDGKRRHDGSFASGGGGREWAPGNNGGSGDNLGAMALTVKPTGLAGCIVRCSATATVAKSVKHGLAPVDCPRARSGMLVQQGAKAVRCLVCDTQMQLVEVIDDTTLLVSGYKRQIWRCRCGDVERRMVFTSAEPPPPPTPRTDGHPTADNVPIEIALEEREKSLAPTKVAEYGAPRTAWNRAADKLRKREIALEQRVLLAAKVSDRIPAV